MRPGPRWVRGVVASTLLLLVASCANEPVAIDPTSPDQADSLRCRALIDALPDSLAGQDRRMISPAAGRGAAWGDPPIVLTCGGDWPLPAALNCQEVDGVDWYAPEDQIADQSKDAVLTTVGYQPAVRVEVPTSRRPPADVLVQLAPMIRGALLNTASCS